MPPGRHVRIDYKKLGYTVSMKQDGRKKKRIATCNFCRKDYHGLAQSRLLDHREVCSPDLSHSNPLQNNSTTVQPTPSSSSSNATSRSMLQNETKQAKLDGFVEQLFMSESEIKQAQLALSKFFFACNLSFLSVENTYFKDFIKIVNPLFAKHLPNRRNLAQELLDEVHKQCIDEDKKRLREYSNLLVDGWTNSVTMTEWNTCLIHNADGVTAFLGAEELECKTAVELSKSVSEMEDLALDVYGTKVYCLETDNAANMIAMGNNKKHVDWHVRCGAHVYNLLVGDLLDKNIEKQVKCVQKFFKYNFRNQLLKEKGKAAILPARTRWVYHL